MHGRWRTVRDVAADRSGRDPATPRACGKLWPLARGVAMLRIHFTSADLGRVRVATAPDPLWEVLLSLHALRASYLRSEFRRWRSHLRGTGYAPAPVLAALAPPVGYSVDFLTPVSGTTDLTTGVEQVLCTPRSQLRADLTTLAAGRRLPPGTRWLADGEPDALRH